MLPVNDILVVYDDRNAQIAKEARSRWGYYCTPQLMKEFIFFQNSQKPTTRLQHIYIYNVYV